MLNKAGSTENFLLSTIFLLLFGLLSFLVAAHIAIVSKIDNGTTTLLRPLIDPLTTKIIITISNLASPAIMTTYAIMITICLASRTHLRSGLNFLLVFCLFNLINHLIKTIIERPRPHHKLVQISGFSFPSGHTFATVILVFLLLALVRKFHYSTRLYVCLAFCGWSLIFLIAFTRVFLHVHFLSDTIGSILLASGSWQLMCGWVKLQNYRRIVHQENHRDNPLH